MTDDFDVDSDLLYFYDTRVMFHTGFFAHVGMTETEWLDKFTEPDSTPIFWATYRDRLNHTPWLDAFATAVENHYWYSNYQRLAEWEKELMIDFEVIFFELVPSTELTRRTWGYD